ncbi:type II secretion system protein [Leucobacter weissii]|uniref:Type II secretion system protein n=1 Tax=Leucobacter weissii TaxID=1983706 RepID=A0A939MHP2_9MICO|nr:type II secretion system protein [Leucobacter weissii]MBO1901109.1 type II secretion system protein [Leucobacter weissii]
MHERERQRSDDRGFSMVEIVIAMFLFALLSVAVIPVIIGVTQLTAQNRDVEAARSAVNADIAYLRGVYPSDPAVDAAEPCSALHAGGGPIGLSSSIGDGMVATRSAAPCPDDPDDFPASVSVRYTIERESDGDVVATFDTSVRVTR